jgi:dienelactone hydrolase
MGRLAIGVAALFLTLSGAGAAEHVDIPLDELKLHTIVFKPEGAGPFPAAVGLHGCEGLVDASGTIFPHYREWGERLAAQGIATIFPDSYRSRGYGSQCRNSERQVRASRARISDANAARRWIQVQTWANAERVTLIGWSHGATSALYAIRPRALVRDGTPDFRLAVAFYPNCGGRLGLTEWSGRVPSLILIGESDDWVSAKACRDMAANARGRSAAVQVVTYPGALHFFDRANLSARELTGIANTTTGSSHVRIGTDAAAREDAFKRVREFLIR